VAGFDHHDLGSDELPYAAIRKLHMNASANEEANVRVHAVIGAGDGLHVLRPAKADRVDGALDAGVTGADGVELNATDFAVFGVLDGSKKWVGGHGSSEGEHCTEVGFEAKAAGLDAKKKSSRSIGISDLRVKSVD